MAETTPDTAGTGASNSASVKGIYDCPACGRPNPPEHCLDADDRYEQRCFETYCVCSCGDCNPQTCDGCGEEFE